MLFVSHNMTAVEALCPRSIHLDSGTIVGDSNTTEVIATYLKSRRAATGAAARAKKIQGGLELEDVVASATTIQCNDPLQLSFHFRAQSPGRIRECVVLIYSAHGTRIAIVDTRESGAVPCSYDGGRFAVNLVISALPLVEGDFTVGLYLATDKFAGDLKDLADFTVTSPESKRGFVGYHPNVKGMVVVKADASVSIPEHMAAAK